jgi:hypothetical protein
MIQSNELAVVYKVLFQQVEHVLPITTHELQVTVLELIPIPQTVVLT